MGTNNETVENKDQECSSIFSDSNAPVVTGEESEKVVFQIRTKLFIRSPSPKLKDGENNWKEVGIGPLRILQQSSNHYRIVQRRETHPHSTLCTKLLLNRSIKEHT